MCGGDSVCGCAKTDVPKVVVGAPDMADAPPTVVNLNQLQDRNGVDYLPNESKPFTGVAVKVVTKGGEKEETTFKDGKQHGSVAGWHPNG